MSPLILAEVVVVGVVVVVAVTCGFGSDELDEPDNSMLAAAEVVEAIAVAERGRVWLCVPSYVVINIDMSSAHL